MPASLTRRRPTKRWAATKPPIGYGLDRAQAQAQGLVGYWLLNEGGGATAFDLAGGHNLALTSATWGAGADGPALAMAGFSSASRMEATAFTAPLAQRFTLAARFKIGTAEGELKTLIAGQGTGVPSLQVHDTNLTIQGTNFGLGATALTGTNAVAVGRWYTVLWSYEAGNNRVWLDGAPQALATNATIAYGDSSVVWGVGGRGSGSILKGQIGWAALWNRALLSAEGLPYGPVLARTSRRSFAPAASGGSVGTAAGSSTVAGVGASTAASAGSASGSSTAPGVGASTAAAVGSSAGTSTAPGVVASTAGSVGSSAGSSTAPGVGVSTASAVGTSAGSSTASGVGSSAGGSAGTSAGTSTAPGVGASTASAVGTAAGTSTAPGVGGSAGGSVGTSAGSSTAPGVGASTASAVGSSVGTSAAQGRSVGTSNFGPIAAAYFAKRRKAG